MKMNNLKFALSLTGLTSVHMNTVFSMNGPVAFTLIHGLPVFLSGRGVGLGTALQVTPFSTSASSSGGLSSNLITSRGVRAPFLEGLVFEIGEPIPTARMFYAQLPSIHSSNFLEELFKVIEAILSSQDNAHFSLMVEAVLPSGGRRSVGHSFNVSSGVTLTQITEFLTPFIEKFEAQSGEQGAFTESTVLRVLNISGSPDPSAQPFTSNPENVDWISKEKGGQKTVKRTTISSTQTNTILEAMQTQTTAILEAMQVQNNVNQAQNNALLEVMKSQVQGPQINWSPVVEGASTLINRIIDRIVPPMSQTPVPPYLASQSPQQAPGEAQVVPQIQPQLEALNSAVTQQAKNLDSLSSTVAQLAKGQDTLTSTLAQQAKILDSLSSTVNQLSQGFNTLTQLVAATTGVPSNGSSSTPPTAPATPSTPATPSPAAPAAPVTPSADSGSSIPNSSVFETDFTRNASKRINSRKQKTSQTRDILNNDQTIVSQVAPGEAPIPEISTPVTGNSHQMVDDLNLAQSQSKKSPTNTTFPEITPLNKQVVEPASFKGQIITADFESLISKDGYNLVYMAAWYNGSDSSIYDISQYGNNTTAMLEAFWLNLIYNNPGRTCYFHNWGGYDAILSLPALVNLPGLTFDPIIHHGEMMSLNIYKGPKLLLTIKDSIKILPGALGKLAKDWKVETQKDHFPHYFNPLELYGILDWKGPIPPYELFEPRRTSQEDYKEMVQEFLGRDWSFLEVSRSYILSDVKSLYQIILSFFNAVVAKFPINPLSVVSAPSTAFKIWRTVQLPLLNQAGHRVYDLSRTLDSQLRGAYLGGIVDVYKPHLTGQGYYYDVNSLYPTAMCQPMPVGVPAMIALTPSQFLESDFFGFVEATVQAPPFDTPGGYVGLLPIKHQGRLICPGGIFKGFFYSEELRFALEHGYVLSSITKAYSFERGVNTFYDLVQTLNTMKVEAQLNKQPTIRSLAKLLNNSLYGRFGMSTDLLQHAIINSNFLGQLSQHYLVQSVVTLGNLYLVSYTLSQNSLELGSKGNSLILQRFSEGLPGNTNVAIAAAVTATSRMIINQFKLKALSLGLEIYYSDTDSLVLNGPLPSGDIDEAKLGKLKLEHTLKEGVFIMPKVYYLETAEGKVVTKCKGYPGNLTRDQYLELMRGNTLNLSVTKWIRSLKNSSVQIQRGTPYTLKFSFNKRQQVINNEGVWVDTKPLILGQDQEGIPRV